MKKYIVEKNGKYKYKTDWSEVIAIVITVSFVVLLLLLAKVL